MTANITLTYHSPPVLQQLPLIATKNKRKKVEKMDDYDIQNWNLYPTKTKITTTTVYQQWNQ